jgi:hypothetical protein
MVCNRCVALVVSIDIGGKPCMCARWVGSLVTTTVSLKAPVWAQESARLGTDKAKPLAETEQPPQFETLVQVTAIAR